MLSLGLVGYGTGGRHFHAPHVAAAEGVRLSGVVTRSRERRAQVEADWPGVPTYDSLADLLAAGVDAVTITTPPETRRALVLEALAGGVHVVADKPFAPDVPVARELAGAARRSGRLLGAYHNRRWDSDVRTLARLLGEGRLGSLWRVHSRFDLDDPHTLEAGPGGGLLRDLGSHLVDQALWLFGPVASVAAHLDHAEIAGERTDVGFVVTLRHRSGVSSVLESSKVNRARCRELRAYGSAGSYRATSSDVQATATLAGARPAADPCSWGVEPREHWGTLATAAGEETVPAVAGRYFDYYSQFAAAARGEGEQPVPASDGVATLEVLEAARRSAEQGVTVPIG